MSRESQTIENTIITRGNDHVLGMFVQVQDKRFAGTGMDPQGEGYVMDYDNASGFTTNFIGANAIDIEDDERLIALTHKFISTLNSGNIKFRKPFASHKAAQTDSEVYEQETGKEATTLMLKHNLGVDPVHKPQTTHTPGPWATTPDGFISHNGSAIARTTDILSSTERQANAQLIAAAPELFERVEGMLESYNLCMAELPEGWYKDRIRGYFHGEPEKAIEVLRKAQGAK